MTHENAGFLLAHGRSKSGSFRFKLPLTSRAKSLFFALNSAPRHKVCHTPRSLFQIRDLMTYLPNLAEPGTCWQRGSTSLKNLEKRFESWTVSSIRFFSLPNSAEKSRPAYLKYPPISPQMAYSLSPYFITLQNEAL